MKTPIFYLACFFLILPVSVPLFAQEQSLFFAKKKSPFLYLFDGAEGIRLAPLQPKQSTTRLSLYDDEKVRAVFPDSATWEVVSGAPQFDSANGRLYFVATQPDPEPDDTTDKNLDPKREPDPAWREQILVAQLPDLTYIGRIPLEHNIYQSVNILLTPNGKQLLVSYDLSTQDEQNFSYIQETFDTTTFRQVGESKRIKIPRNEWRMESGRTVYFSENARYSQDGNIYDTTLPNFGVRTLPTYCDLVIRDNQARYFQMNKSLLTTLSIQGYEVKDRRQASCDPASATLWKAVKLIVSKPMEASAGRAPATSASPVPIVSNRGEMKAKVISKQHDPIANESSLYAPSDSFSFFLTIGANPHPSERPYYLNVRKPGEFNPCLMTVATDRKTAYFVNTDKKGDYTLYIFDLTTGEQIETIDINKIAPEFTPQSLILYNK